MADFTLYYWPVPFRGQFVRAVLAHAGKSWEERDAAAIGEEMRVEPARQVVPFMGPPVLVDHANDFALAEMPAILGYLGETLHLTPTGPQARWLTVKVVNDANDVLDEITLDGGREMWTPAKWRDFLPRLRRWMAIWEETGRRHGLKADRGYLLGGSKASTADIVTATLWGTMIDRFPSLREILEEEAPAVAALTDRLMATKALADLLTESNEHYDGAYCGGEIEASLRKVVG